MAALPDRETLCAALDVVDVGLALVGPDDGIRFCNAAYAEMVGRPGEELQDLSVTGGGSPCDTFPRASEQWNGTETVSVAGTSPLGEPVDVVARPVMPGSDVRIVVVRRGLVRSVSGRFLSPEVAEEVRRFVTDLTGHEADPGSLGSGPLSILMLGLARVDELERRYGTEGVEDVLRQVARALVLQKRKADIISRYGEGQFLVLAPDTPRYGAIMLAERIQDSVAELDIVVDGDTLDVELLTYAAEYRPNMDGTVSEAVEKASKALEERAGNTVG